MRGFIVASGFLFLHLGPQLLNVLKRPVARCIEIYKLEVCCQEPNGYFGVPHFSTSVNQKGGGSLFEPLGPDLQA